MTMSVNPAAGVVECGVWRLVSWSILCSITVRQCFTCALPMESWSRAQR